MGCSNLNSHLTLMLHVKNDSSCRCGFNIESPKHYFLNCPLYAGPRQKLVNKISRLTDCNINVILFGDKNLSLNENKAIFRSVHKFIKDSKRFL